MLDERVTTATASSSAGAMLCLTGDADPLRPPTADNILRCDDIRQKKQYSIEFIWIQLKAYLRPRYIYRHFVTTDTAILAAQDVLLGSIINMNHSWTWVHFSRRNSIQSIDSWIQSNPIQSNPGVHNLHPIQSYAKISGIKSKL